MIRVQSVAPDSLGAELGLTPGTELLAVNGRALEDFLDWEFLTADDRFVLGARMATGQEVEFDIERPEGLAMGVTLEPPRIRRGGVIGICGTGGAHRVLEARPGAGADGGGVPGGARGRGPDRHAGARRATGRGSVVLRCG